MFNRSNFDRTLYDRSSRFDGVEAVLRGNSQFRLGVVVQVYLMPFTLGGSGTMSASTRMRQATPIAFMGESDFSVSDFRLRMPINSAMVGAGSMTSGVGVKVPFEASLSGLSEMSVDSRTYLLQHMETLLRGHGGLELPLNLLVFLSSLMDGGGALELDDRFTLLLPIMIFFGGSGDLELHRVGALDSETIAFENLNLRPGQTLIIDSDEQDVYIDNKPDVSSVTSDSVFFHLQPGENEITFETNTSSILDATLIWQNRWL